MDGVEYLSPVFVGGSEAGALERIQVELAGTTSVPTDPPFAHLRMRAQAAVEEPGQALDSGEGRYGPTLVSLWVPDEQTSEAERSLRSAGFTVEDD